MKIKKARKIWNMMLRGKSLNWNEHTIRKAMDIANTHFLVMKVRRPNEFENMKDWVFRKHI